MSPRSRAYLVSACTLLVPVSVALLVQQHARYRRASEMLDGSLLEADAAVAQIHAARSRRQQLEEELSRIELDLARLEEILPKELDADELLEGVRRRSARFGLEVEECDFRVDRESVPPKGELLLLFRGRPEAVDAFAGTVSRWAWLATFSEIERGSGWSLATVTVHAAPPESSRELLEVSGDVPVPWLPPFRSLVVKKRELLRQAEAEIARNTETYERVRRFESRKARLQQEVDLIVALKKRNEPEGEPGSGEGPEPGSRSSPPSDRHDRPRRPGP